MSLFKFALSADKSATIRRELGNNAAAYFAAMQAAEKAFFTEITNDHNQESLTWLQLRSQLITRIDNFELAGLDDFNIMQIQNVSPLQNGLLRQVEVVTLTSLAAAIEDISRQRWLGFDTETAPTFEKGKRNTNPISLIQIATATHCYLFRMQAENKQPFIAALNAVLNDDKQLKVGIGLRSDINAMKRDFDISISHILDLNWLLNQLGAPKQLGTQQMTATVLGLKLPKSKKVTLSDWSKPISEPLTELQVQYAAADALVALDILHGLIEQIKPYKNLWPKALIQRLTELDY
ncbi:3'-5' exonuclease [Shewanella fidelis]|uniref:3'-5' exonuclease n=1 Tax=Shewanella fidelis TaxID=173509 RepID=A0AAW8NJP9_9GAMM|nr:3'-5' exonuclease [Shewanella fidelis]MDR8522510.1 3'-5' exonuclease domain-containing protein 2 [Shewanella fidelis]MDW4812956.1 3'-5' exonuclease domain-containing protein 2 [Shewanella fidelis]MDW4816785.1 3'-5' exonuclease domain-containing protein 2 [Shewanella fidelis]MDW4820963.1 3'-5' exonuclease domain-containing protein 2 [Shewanella fidelis]MDW4825502.1 3'-5' exonuclease domain-containing protein 2 [Shewanella fidelis]